MMSMMLLFTFLLSSIAASFAADIIGDNMKAENPNKNGFITPDGVNINISTLQTDGHAPPQQIVNGTETDGPVGFMVGLRKNAKGAASDTNAPFCGGSLIAPRIVLTAANCMSNFDLYEVIVNMYDVTNKTGVESIALNRGVLGEDIIIHPDYDEDTLENDIALMILPHEVTGITYAKLNEDARQVGDVLRVIGWGRTSLGGEKSDILLEAEVDFVTNKQCNEPYEGFVTDGMLCAARDGTGPCQGDSGGPMMLASDEGDPIQVGITSWGYGGYECANPNYPGVYTRVSYYADWIKKTACAFTGEFCPTCGVSQSLMKVIVHTDNYPVETSWKVTNKCGSSSDPIMWGGDYPKDSKYTTEVTLDCVSEGEYEFTIEVRA